MKRVACAIGTALGLAIVAVTWFGLAPEAQAQTTPWAASGPAPIINTLDNTQPDGGSVGAIETVAAHPTNPDILYIGSVNGGIWKTTNATASAPTWVSLGDGFSSASVSALEFDPNDGTHQTLVGGQGGTSSFARIAGKVGGLLRTTDGGANWTEITDPILEDKSISAVIARGAVLVASAGEFRDDGGLFLSVNTGASWTSLGIAEGLPSADLKVFDVVGDPTSLTRLYAAVEDEVAGAGGIFRSDNGGGTWTNISSGDAALTTALGDAIDANDNGAELAVNAAGRLYAVVIRGFSGQPEYIGYTDDPTSATPTWVEMDLPLVPELPNPLPIADASNASPIRISMPSGPITDASDTTPIVITSTGHGRSTGDFVFVENVTGNLGANGYFNVTVLDTDSFELDGSAGAGLFTGGGTWGLYHFLYEGFGTKQVQISGVTGNTAANGEFFVGIVNPTQFELYDYYFEPVAGSGTYSGGGTYQIVTGVSPSPDRGGQGDIHFSLAADGTTIYVGGDTQRFPFGAPNSLGALNYEGRLFRGDTTVAPTGSSPSPQWEHLTHSDGIATFPGGGTANSTATHADSRQMVFDASGGLIEVDDGGIFRRTSPGDNTGDWFSMNSNLQITEFHAIAYDSNSDIIFGGTQDNGTVAQQTTGSMTWTQLQGGDGGDAVVETTSSPGFSVRYTQSQFLGGFTQRTYDAANNEVLTVFPDLEITDGSSGSAWFYGPVEVNAIDPLRFVLGLPSNVLETFNQGDTLSSVDFGGGLGANGNFARRTIAYGGVRGGSPDADLLYIGSGTAVYARLSSGVAPTPTAGAFPGDDVQALRPDPDDWDRLVVVDIASVFTPAASSRVWLTEDTGGTWTDITGDLPTMELMTVEYLSGTVDRIVVAGQAGVWRTSVTSPGTWTEISDGLPTAIIEELYYDRTDDVLVAGTLGRGAYLLTEATCGDGASDPDGDLVCDPDDNCPNDANPGQEDGDGDLTGDACDDCPTDPAKTDPGFCGCLNLETDTDGDTVPDCVDPCPADNPDDTDGDSVCDSLDPCPLDNPDDTDLDGTCDSADDCPTDPDKIVPGVCGCNVADTDEAFVGFLGEFGQGPQSVYFPRDLAVDELDRVWVADTATNRLQVYDNADNWLFSVGSLGSNPGEFNFPEGIAADGAGKIYVSDGGNNRIQVLDIFGNFLYEFGSFGSLDGEFDGPFGIDVDENGRILVADASNNRIQVFDNSGLHLISFGLFGALDGEFDFPLGVAWDAVFDQILVADSANDRIQGFDAAGTWLWTFGSSGTGLGQFDFPIGVLTSGPDLVVSDTFNHRIQFLTNTGSAPTAVTQSGSFGLAPDEYQAPGGLALNLSDELVIADINNSRAVVRAGPTRSFGGPQPGQLLQPEDVTLDASGRVYVANTFRGRVEVYDASGSFLFGMGGLGTAAGELQEPVGLTIDGTGRVWVAERANNRVSVFDSAGVFQFSFDSTGSTAGPLSAPHGIGYDATTSEIHVVDAGNNRVQIFDTGGVFASEYGILGSGPGQLTDPSDIASDGSGVFWIADTGNDRLQSFFGGSPGVSIGTTGSGPGQFNFTQGVAVHPTTGDLYASDGTDDRVQVLNSIGGYLREFGSFGSGAGQFDFAAGVAVSPATKLYVADRYNSRVHVWEPGLQDADSDGSANCAESCPDDPTKTAPGVCGCNVPDVDTDLDTLEDCLDACPLDPFKTAYGICGCGVPDVDTDGDSVVDCIDPCPLDNPDDTDLDGTCDTDDGCPTDPNKTDPGICGCNELDSGREFVASIGTYGEGDGETIYARAVAVDSLDRSFVTDTNNNEIDVFDSSGTFLFSFGSVGTGSGQFTFPEGIAADGLGRIYVADGGNHRVQVFDTAGVYQFEFGTFGTLDGEFDTPIGVAINAVNQIVVADSNNHRVQVFDNAGSHIFTSGGIQGTLLGEFDLPWDVEVDPATGNIWVSEFNNSRVQVLNSGGTAQFTFGTAGTGPGDFNSATGIVFDGLGNVFVADAFNHRIQRFDTTGVYQSEFGVRGNDDGDLNAPVGMTLDGAGNLQIGDANNSRFQVVDTTGIFVRKFGGPQGGQMINPQGITVDSAGRLIVADTGLSRIQVFDGLGQFLFDFSEPGTGPGQIDEAWEVATDGANRIYVSDTFNHRVQVFDSAGVFLFEFGANGSLPGEFSFPVGLALNDADTALYVADFNNARIQAFNPATGAFQFESGVLGSGPGQLDSPYGLDADSSRIYVTEDGNDRVQVLDQVAGAFILEFGTTGSGPGQFDFARDVAVDDATGDIYVSDNNLHRVSIFDSSGVFQSEFGVFGSGDGEFDAPAGLALGSLWISDTFNNRIQLWDDRGQDKDGDGSGNCVDCAPLDPLIYPGATELCDGLDNDCNAGADFPGETTDGDTDKSLTCADCNDADPTIYPGAPELCDGLDNDCDTVIPADEIDDDTDTFAECQGDCDDGDPENFPGNTEVCDGQDNDCNAAADFPGETTDVDADGSLTCADCDDGDPENFPGNTEVCDGQDNDCDTIVPAVEIDDDTDTFAECEGDCDDADPSRFPGADEVCDGKDNDCDGPIDEDPIDGTTWYADTDSDGFGDPAAAVEACTQPPSTVTDNTDCSDANGSIWAIPGESQTLMFAADKLTLSWTAPSFLGGLPGSPIYDMLRTSTADDFVTGLTCVETDDGADFVAFDIPEPPPGGVFFYLSRAENDCGQGPLGDANPAGPRPPGGACM